MRNPFGCFFSHKFGNWVEFSKPVKKKITFDSPPGMFMNVKYNGPMFYEVTQYWQKRRCRRCGKVEMVFIAEAT